MRHLRIGEQILGKPKKEIRTVEEIIKDASKGKDKPVFYTRKQEDLPVPTIEPLEVMIPYTQLNIYTQEEMMEQLRDAINMDLLQEITQDLETNSTERKEK